MTKMKTIDSTDARILLALDDDPDASILALARTLGLARNTVQARLSRLGRNGALRSFSQRVDPAALGYPLTAFVYISVSQELGRLGAEGLARIPEVIEIHSITGDADFLAKVVARDTEDLYRVTNGMLAVEGVVRTNTSISLVETMPTRLRALLETAVDAD